MTILGAPIAVERLSLDTVVLILAAEEDWFGLDRDEAEERLAEYGPALRRLGHDSAAITPERLGQACLALGHAPNATLARRLLAAKRDGFNAVRGGLGAAEQASSAAVLADAARVWRAMAAACDGAARAAYREGVLTAVHRLSGTPRARLALDIACALALGSAVPSAHDRLEIATAAGRMA